MAVGSGIDARQQVALQQLRRRQRQTTIIQGLENRVRIRVGRGRDFDEVDVLDQPVDERLQRHGIIPIGGRPRFVEHLVQLLLDQFVVLDDTGHRLRLPVVVEAPVVEQRLHALCPILYVEVQGGPPRVVRVDELREGRTLGAVLQPPVQGDQKERDRRETLLAVRDEPPSRGLADHDGSQKVPVMIGHVSRLAMALLARPEGTGEVVQRLGNLLLFPPILPLEVVDAEPRVLQQAADVLRLASDFLHLWPPRGGPVRESRPLQLPHPSQLSAQPASRCGRRPTGDHSGAERQRCRTWRTARRGCLLAHVLRANVLRCIPLDALRLAGRTRHGRLRLVAHPAGCGVEVHSGRAPASQRVRMSGGAAVAIRPVPASGSRVRARCHPRLDRRRGPLDRPGPARGRLSMRSITCACCCCSHGADRVD